MNERQKEIIRCLIKPMTIYDLGDELEASYHTIRRDLMVLVEAGLARELPFPQPGTKRKRYQRNDIAVAQGRTGQPVEPLHFTLGNSEAPIFNLDINMILELGEAACRIVAYAISKPLADYYSANISPREELFPDRELAHDKLDGAILALQGILDFANQVYYAPVWDDAERDASILLGSDPDRVPWEKIFKMEESLFQLAVSRGWEPDTNTMRKIVERKRRLEENPITPPKEEPSL